MSIRALACVLVVAMSIACGPPRLGGETTSGDGSTSEQGTDSSTGSESSTSESGEAPTTDSADTSDGWDFVPEEDEYFHCDPYAQDCPEGEKCVPYSSAGGSWDAHKCVPVLGNQAPGEACTYGGVIEATDDCDETSACWDVKEVDGQAIGVCTPFCLGSEDMPECPPNTHCTISSSGIINFCILICDPILQDCSDGNGCFWDGNDFVCAGTTVDIPAGEPCAFINDCAKGLSCLAAEYLPSCEADSCCSGFCDLNLGDGPCEALLPGTACVPFYEENEAPPAYEHVGVCIVGPP